MNWFITALIFGLIGLAEVSHAEDCAEGVEGNPFIGKTRIQLTEGTMRKADKEIRIKGKIVEFYNVSKGCVWSLQYNYSGVIEETQFTDACCSKKDGPTNDEIRKLFTKN